MNPIDSWLASAAIQIVETVQQKTIDAPAEVRRAMTPGQVDRAIVDRVMQMHGIRPASWINAA